MGGEGGVAEGGDREMGKGRIGMNEVSVYMNACVRVWKEREKGEMATKLYISSLCIGFLDYEHMYHSNSQLTS